MEKRSINQHKDLHKCGIRFGKKLLEIRNNYVQKLENKYFNSWIKFMVILEN
jgi:hypothetical protein